MAQNVWAGKRLGRLEKVKLIQRKHDCVFSTVVWCETRWQKYIDTTSCRSYSRYFTIFTENAYWVDLKITLNITLRLEQVGLGLICNEKQNNTSMC